MRIDLPVKARPWDTSDVALVAAVAAEDGHAVIGFKEAASMAAQVSGTRSAVTGATIRGALEMLRGRGVEIVQLLDAIGAAHIRMDPTLAPALRHNPLVDYIEPRQWGRIAGVPLLRSAALAMPFGQTIPWGIAMVRAPEAWTITQGFGATIELIDTGHDRGHEDLPLVPLDHCAGAYGGCDDGFPIPHGTHVLGIWTARDNAVGVIGVAPGIDGTRVYVWGACDNYGSCSTTEVATGIVAGIWNAKVISLSLHVPDDISVSNAVAQAWANDIVIVAAAGNSQGRTVVYPAGYTNVVGVSGVQDNEQFASTSPCVDQYGTHASSNYGPHVDLAAPFWALSTVPGGYQDQTSGWCGTSMATPHVSGAAALVRDLHPTWHNYEVVSRLFATAHDRGAPGLDEYYGYGIVDAAAAVGVPVPPPPSLSVTMSGPSRVRPNVNCAWWANASGGVPPYSYTWIPAGSQGPDPNEVIESFSQPGTVTLTAWVYDAAGQQASVPKTITVTSSALMCFY